MQTCHLKKSSEFSLSRNKHFNYQRQTTLAIGGRITVQLIFNLTGLDLAKQKYVIFMCWNYWIQTGDQPYSDTSPYGVL